MLFLGLAIWNMSSVVAVLSRYEENAKWISKHYEELKKKLTDEWVAAFDSAIIDHDRELNKLVKRLRKKYTKDYNEIAVDYVTTKEIELIL
jgi:di/tricarboxylate transporter